MYEETLGCDNPNGPFLSPSVCQSIEAAKQSLQRLAEAARKSGEAFLAMADQAEIDKRRKAVTAAARRFVEACTDALVALIPPCVDYICKIAKEILAKLLPTVRRTKKRPPASLGRLHIRRLLPLCHKTDYG